MKIKYTEEFLLSKGIKLNEEGRWLLHCPTFIEDEETLKQSLLELIDCFAGDSLIINLVDNSGKTALHYAAMYGNKTIIDALLPHMTTDAVSFWDTDGNTALEYSYENRHQDIFDTLLPVTLNGNNFFPLGYDHAIIESAYFDSEDDESVSFGTAGYDHTVPDTTITGQHCDLLPE